MCSREAGVSCAEEPNQGDRSRGPLKGTAKGTARETAILVATHRFVVYNSFQPEQKPNIVPTPPYIELHCHSGFSFLDGASHPEELVFRALELGYPALALTDHNGLYGSMEFAQAAHAEGLQPITGAEVTVALNIPGIPEGLDGLGVGDLGGDLDVDPLIRGCHMTILAETPAGYANLCRLLSEAHLQSERGRPTRVMCDTLPRVWAAKFTSSPLNQTSTAEARPSMTLNGALP